MSYFPQNDKQDFGSAGNLAAAENSVVEFDNTGGYSTVRVHVTPPTGGTVVFETTSDGVNWISTTLRTQISDIDEYKSSTDTEDDFIGSIAGARKFRCRTSVAGSAPGSAIGRGQRDTAVYEGQEFNAPPDRIGRVLVHKDVSYTDTQTGAVIWTPVAGKRFIVTDLIIVAFGATDALVTIFDETDVTGSRIFRGFLDTSVNGSIIIPVRFAVPYVSASQGNVLKITTSAGIDIDVMVNGYEAS